MKNLLKENQNRLLLFSKEIFYLCPLKVGSYVDWLAKKGLTSRQEAENHRIAAVKKPTKEETSGRVN
ncbi:MAG: hypothetical protein IJZ86_03170 [Bacteroides sp.]|nr:hypothetical protein [Bacteroides sp.]